MQGYRGLAYLLAANMEAAALLLAAWWVGEWMNEKYPMTISWYAVTFSVAVVIILHSWYTIFKKLFAIESDEQKLNKKG